MHLHVLLLQQIVLFLHMLLLQASLELIEVRLLRRHGVVNTSRCITQLL